MICRYAKDKRHGRQHLMFNAAEPRNAYPTFFWKAATLYIQDTLRYMRITQEGKEWIARLYAQIFAEEHKMPGFGPERT